MLLRTGENKKERDKGNKKVVSPSPSATSHSSGPSRPITVTPLFFSFIYLVLLSFSLLFSSVLFIILLLCSFLFLSSPFRSVLSFYVPFPFHKQMHILLGYQVQLCKTEKHPGFALYIQVVEGFFHSSYALHIHFCYTHTHSFHSCRPFHSEQNRWRFIVQTYFTDTITFIYFVLFQPSVH